jgi:hypothetical protein
MILNHYCYVPSRERNTQAETMEDMHYKEAKN